MNRTICSGALVFAALGCSPLVNAQRPASVNYNASKSNTGNIVISNGAACTTIIVATGVTGNVTGSTSTTIPCTVPAGEYIAGSGAIAPTITEIPQFVDGGSWQTTLVITNATASAASASFTFYQETVAADGSTQPWTPAFVEASNPQNIALAPGSTTFLHTPGTAASLSIGWGQMSAPSGVTAYALFTWSSTSGGQGTAPSVSGQDDVLLPYDNTAINGTAVAIANPTSSSETVTVNFRTDGGATSQSTIALPANGHKAFLLRAQFPSTAGTRGLAEFTTTNDGGVALIGLQFNALDNFTTAQATPLNNRPAASIITASDPLTCVLDPPAAGCPNPAFLMLTLTANYSAGGNSFPVTINITPGANGTYNAALSGMINGTTVSGSFIGGNFSISKYIDQTTPMVWTFSTAGPQSTFNAGSLTFNLTFGSYDANTGQAVGTASGQLALQQAGASGGLIDGQCIYIYFPATKID